MILLALVMAIGMALAVSLLQAFVILLLLPYSGLPFDPTFWQVYVLCLIVHVLTANVSTKVS